MKRSWLTGGHLGRTLLVVLTLLTWSVPLCSVLQLQHLLAPAAAAGPQTHQHCPQMHPPQQPQSQVFPERRQGCLLHSPWGQHGGCSERAAAAAEGTPCCHSCCPLLLLCCCCCRRHSHRCAACRCQPPLLQHPQSLHQQQCTMQCCCQEHYCCQQQCCCQRRCCLRLQGSACVAPLSGVGRLVLSTAATPQAHGWQHHQLQLLQHQVFCVSLSSAPASAWALPGCDHGAAAAVEKP